MSDITRDINSIKQNFIFKGDLREKDLEKTRYYGVYSKTVVLLTSIPIGLQIYQATLINKAESLEKYNRIRQLKWAGAVVALSFGVHSLFDLDKKWQFLERLFPEMSEYQKNLSREAQLFKIRGDDKREFKPKTQFSVDEARTYRQKI